MTYRRECAPDLNPMQAKLVAQVVLAKINRCAEKRQEGAASTTRTGAGSLPHCLDRDVTRSRSMCVVADEPVLLVVVSRSY